MLRHLLEMMPASKVSGPGRDSAINLLVKQVPRKSLKNPDNSLTLWVIDQGMNRTCTQNFSYFYDMMDMKQTRTFCHAWIFMFIITAVTPLKGK